jgi:glycosyltransferase involved in cell wall biosynthesis
MATSIPVVASDVGANGDVITHGSDGYLASSPEEWITCLSRLIADDRARRSFGANGRAKVEERYNTQVIAQQISAIIGSKKELV